MKAMVECNSVVWNGTYQFDLQFQQQQQHMRRGNWMVEQQQQQQLYSL